MDKEIAETAKSVIPKIIEKVGIMGFVTSFIFGIIFYLITSTDRIAFGLLGFGITFIVYDIIHKRITHKSVQFRDNVIYVDNEKYPICAGCYQIDGKKINLEICNEYDFNGEHWVHYRCPRCKNVVEQIT